jgi:sodium/potassium-transporting ATPase subunit alpha
MNPHLHDIERLYAQLHSNAQGLGSAEAEQRLRQHGPNRLEEVAKRSLFSRLLAEFTHFFALMLWVAAGLAFFAEWNEPGQGMRMMGYAIVGVIVINGVFSFWQEYRTERALIALRKLLPRNATALRDGKAVQLSVEALVPGDVVLLAAGDDVPADCRLIEAFSLRVNASNLTGESRPVARDAAAADDGSEAQARNLLHAGTSLVSGKAQAIVYATGMQTEFGNIARLTQTAIEPPSPLQKEIVYVSRLIGVFSVLLGVAFFLLGRTLGLTTWENLVFAIGIIAANVPEGLLPTVTLSLTMATQRMARKNALVRHLPAVESLGSTTVICSDKTGTLTQNSMTVRQAYCAGRMLERDGMATAVQLHDIMRHCHDLRRIEKNGQWVWQGDSMEVALLESVPAGGAMFPRLDEIPFDTERKRMSVICDTPQGHMLYCKGAPETVLPLCISIWQEGGVAPLDEAGRAGLRAVQEEMAQRGLRVLALAYRAMPLQAETRETGMIFAGLVGLIDPPRSGVAEAMRTCHEAGIRVIMITGDHPHTAGALAREIGLAQDPVTVCGDELHELSDADLLLLLNSSELIFARTSAEQKMRIVQALQRKGEVVAVTGDGVNDAPALKCADIGIAMGISGTDVAKEAADIVLLDDHFATIVTAIEEGRAVFDNLRKFLTYILVHNVAEMLPYIAFVLFRVPLGLTVIQILALDLGTETLPALALGVERPDRHIMRKPPRPRNERLLNGSMLLRIYLFLGLLEGGVAMTAFFYVLHSGGWQHGQIPGLHDSLYLQATTACFSAIILMQVVNIFLCRHPTLSAFSRDLRSNRLIFYGIVFELVMMLLIDYTALGNTLFGTAPLGMDVWLFILPFGVGMWLMEEVRKAVVRGMERRKAAAASRASCSPQN